MYSVMVRKITHPQSSCQSVVVGLNKAREGSLAARLFAKSLHYSLQTMDWCVLHFCFHLFLFLPAKFHEQCASAVSNVSPPLPPPPLHLVTPGLLLHPTFLIPKPGLPLRRNVLRMGWLIFNSLGGAPTHPSAAYDMVHETTRHLHANKYYCCLPTLFTISFAITASAHAKEMRVCNSCCWTLVHALTTTTWRCRQSISWTKPRSGACFSKAISPGEVSASAFQVLLDIGAGVGFYSLAAAAAGRSVEAFELGPKNLASLRASIAHNDFSDRISGPPAPPLLLPLLPHECSLSTSLA